MAGISASAARLVSALPCGCPSRPTGWSNPWPNAIGRSGSGSSIEFLPARPQSIGLGFELLGQFFVFAGDLDQPFAQRPVLLARRQGADLRGVAPIVRRPLARQLQWPPAFLGCRF